MKTDRSEEGVEGQSCLSFQQYFLEGQTQPQLPLRIDLDLEVSLRYREDAEAILRWPCFCESGVSNTAFAGKYDETGKLFVA